MGRVLEISTKHIRVSIRVQDLIAVAIKEIKYPVLTYNHSFSKIKYYLAITYNHGCQINGKKKSIST